METKRKAWETEAEIIVDLVLIGKDNEKTDEELIERVRAYLERRMYLKLNFKR